MWGYISVVLSDGTVGVVAEGVAVQVNDYAIIQLHDENGQIIETEGYVIEVLGDQ